MGLSLFLQVGKCLARLGLSPTKEQMGSPLWAFLTFLMLYSVLHLQMAQVKIQGVILLLASVSGLTRAHHGLCCHEMGRHAEQVVTSKGETRQAMQVTDNRLCCYKWEISALIPRPAYQKKYVPHLITHADKN